MRKLLPVLRWILVIPSAYVGVGITLAFGAFLFLIVHGLALQFCVKSEVTGYCTSQWVYLLERSVFMVIAGASAAVAVLYPTLLATAFRPVIAVLAYGVGAWHLATLEGDTFEIEKLSAALTGAIACLFVVAHEIRVRT